jgi:septum formation topological specificity factor MinE
MDVAEIEFLITEIMGVLKELSIKTKVLLITSLRLNDKLSPYVLNLGNMILQLFNKYIEIDKNKTNDKFKMLIQEKQGADYVTVKKYLSLTAEDVLTVIGR